MLARSSSGTRTRRRRGGGARDGSDALSVPSSASAVNAAVAEVSGEYGSFAFSERVLQKLWYRGEVDDSGARLEDGRPVRVLESGRWNHLGGPDFRAAVIEIEGRRRIGDVEVHLWERDWYAHGHGSDPAYDNVILHAVLFPVRVACTEGRDGRRIPVLVLLPLLRRGLEDYAADDVVERLAGRPETRMLEVLLAFPPAERRARVSAAGVARWTEKVGWARRRLERLGWIEACHHAALQTLGARANRGAMLQVAGAWPLAAWRHCPDLPARIWVDDAVRSRWILHGVRPCNHPRIRLQQYAEWIARVPDWPDRLWEFPWPEIPFVEEASTQVRRRLGLGRLREAVRQAVGGNVMGSGRFDSVVCDAWLPLLAARGREVAGVWFHWFPGEIAPAARAAMLSLSPGLLPAPLCQGMAQGIWALGLGQETDLQQAPIGEGRGA